MPFERVHLAPMEGVVDPILRDVLTRIGGLDRCVTEFIRVTRQLLPDHVFYRYCPELAKAGQTASGIPVYVQLLGGDPHWLGENAKRAAELGAPGIDLNFGCPAKTVNRHDGGAAILKDPQRVYHIVRAVRTMVPDHIPVTAKVRLGYENKEFFLDIAEAAEQGGASELTVHARTKVDGYRPPAYWDYIAKIKQVLKIPVVANGEVWSLTDAKGCRDISGCDRLALGRGLIADPFLALRIKRNEDCLSLEDSWRHLQPELKVFFDVSEESRGPQFALSRLKQWLKFLGRTYPEAIELFEVIKVMLVTSEVRKNLGWN